MTLKDIDLVDVMLVVGLLMIGAGLGAWDWRVALVVCGTLLFVGGVVLGWRAARSG